MVWSLEATDHGLRVRRHGDSPWELDVEEDTAGVRRHELRLWVHDDGRAVVRLPGPTPRPALIATDEGARYIHPLPTESGWSSTRCRFHADGTLTFVDGAGLAPGDCTVVWHTSIDGTEWEPVVGPPGFVGHDVAKTSEGLWLGGHWTDAALAERRAAVLLIGLDGEVLREVAPAEPGRRWRRRNVPASGTFFGVHVGGPYLVAVRPRLADVADEATDVWVGAPGDEGSWVRFDDVVVGVRADVDGVAVCLRDGRVATTVDGRSWEERRVFSGPVRDVAWRDGTVAAAVADPEGDGAVAVVPGGEVWRSPHFVASVALA